MRKLLLLVCLGLLVSACASTEAPTQDGARSPTPTVLTQPVIEPSAAIQTDEWELKVLEVKTSPGTMYVKPDAKHYFVMVKMSVRNFSELPREVYDLVNFRLKTGEGKEINPTSTTLGEKAVDAKLEPQQEVAGWLSYEPELTETALILSFSYGNASAQWHIQMLPQ